MNPLKIGIVEDDPLIAESLVVALQSIGYNPAQPASNFNDAQRMIRMEQPDLLLLDIVLDRSQDGIAVAEWVNTELGIPFIFLTGNSDDHTIQRAKAVHPSAYLLKPFDEQTLYSSIEIAFNNFNGKKISHKGDLKDFAFIKKGDTFYKVEAKDILYIESENVYLDVHTSDQHYLVRAKLDEFMEGFAKSPFVRVHRSIAINLTHLGSINTDTVIVAGKEIPLQKNYKQELLEMVNSFR